MSETAKLFLRAAEFDRTKTIEQAKHEDSDGYFGFLTGAEWQHARLQPLLTRAAAVIEAADEVSEGDCGCPSWDECVKTQDSWKCSPCILREALAALREACGKEGE